MNLGVALLAEKINPKVRTVVRLFDAGLAEKVQAHLDVDVAMGAARVAAPMFVAAALEDGVAAAVVSGGALHVLKKSARPASSGRSARWPESPRAGLRPRSGAGRGRRAATPRRGSPSPRSRAPAP